LFPLRVWRPAKRPCRQAESILDPTMGGGYTEMESGIGDKARRRFTAHYLADLSKADFAVALASKLFIDLGLWLRVGLTVLGIMFFVAGLFLLPKGEKE